MRSVKPTRSASPSSAYATSDAGNPPAENPAWHAMASADALEVLRTTAEGLSDDEAAQRLNIHGRNRLPQGPHRSLLMRFLLQFHNLLIYVLLAAGALAATIGHGTDALVILAVVIVNAIIGFVQEGRAEKALDAIRGMIDPHASVLRGGRRVTIGADACRQTCASSRRAVSGSTRPSLPASRYRSTT